MDELNKIIDRYTDGNYLIGKTAKEEMAKDILALFNVSQQRELLLAFGKWYNNNDVIKPKSFVLSDDVEMFLANNCG